MAQLSLQQLFGANAIQERDRLVIDKGDLFQLTASATNTAESLLVAILLNAHRNFEGNIEHEQGNAITDELGENITFSNSNLYELLNLFYWNHQFITVNDQPKILDTFVIEYNEV